MWRQGTDVQYLQTPGEPLLSFPLDRAHFLLIQRCGRREGHWGGEERFGSDGVRVDRGLLNHGRQ